MAKEELEKEAEEYVKQNHCDFCVMADDCESGCIDCFTVQAYIVGAEPREKRIEELEKKIKRISDYLAYKIPHELMNEATNKIWNMV